MSDWNCSEGKIALMSPAPNLEHQRISRRLSYLITDFLEDKHCEVFFAPFDVRLKRKGESGQEKDIYTVVQPDLCVVCDLSKLDTRGCLGAPDLVIEILSPGNSRKELRDKYELYQEAGVREYWLVTPEKRSVSVYVLNEEEIFIGLQPLTDEEILRTDILPGLEIDLAYVFGKEHQQS